MPHRQLQIEEKLAALPGVKNFQVVTNHRYDWHQRKGKYAGFQRSYIFKIDAPWTAIVPTASVYHAPEQLGLFDPVLFWQHHFRGPDWQSNMKLKCPHCGNREGVQHNGWADGVRTAVGVRNSWPVLVRRYKCIGCSECKDGGKKRTFTAVHPEVVAQYSETFRNSRDMFIIRHRVACIEKPVLQLVNMFMMHCSFEFMAKAFADVQFNDFLAQANAYMSHCLGVRSFVGSDYEFEEFGGFDDLSGYNGRALGRKLLADCYILDHEGRYPAMMACMESLSGDT
jgi:hypothetical protein